MNYKICRIFGLILLFIYPSISNSQVSITPTASFLGTHSHERVGYHVHPAGDVNDDGYDDFLIGTFHNRAKGYNSGAAYLILGKKAANWGFNNSLTLSDARFIGGAAYDAVGYYLGGGGDLNGDGYDDFLIGAPAGDEHVIQNPGHLYVVFGKASPDWGYNCILPSSADASFDGENQHDLAGLSAAIIGDMNNDGYDDIICSAPYNDYGRTDAGKAYLILGKPNGWARRIDLINADASFYGTSRNGLVGYSVDGVGDVNGDGIPDIAIGARGVRKVYLIFGRYDVDWGFNYNINLADVIFHSEQYGDWTGWRVSKAGDVNADGFDDFLIAAPLYNYNGSDAGKVYLILGRSSGWKNNLSEADASYLGEAAEDQAGWDVQDAGDVNGDDYDDFVIGAWYNDSNGEDSGKMYIIKGKPSGWQRNVSLSQIEDYFVGEHAGDYAGFSVSYAGDINGDGWSDLVTSSTYNDDAYIWGGKIYLFVSQRDEFNISGNIIYYNESYPIFNTQVVIRGQKILTDTTDFNGNYEFLDLPDDNYVVRAEKENGIGSAINAFDAAWILQYGVGLRTFTPYQLIAADVSGNGDVSSYDAAKILQYGVGLINQFSVMTDSIHFWRFVPEDFPITDTNWYTAPDSIAYIPLNSDTTDNYVGIIYGDVSGNWHPATGGLAKSIVRTIDISLGNVCGQAGDNIFIPLYVDDGSDIISMSFTMEFDPRVLNALGVSLTSLTKDYLISQNVYEEGRIKVALAGSRHIEGSGAVVNLEFEVLESESQDAVSSLQITEMVINDGNIAANIQAARFAMGAPAPDECALHQNYPNPFNPETVIKYQLPKSGKVVLKIYNIVGQEIRTLLNREMEAGIHEIYWNGMDDQNVIVSSGVYIYKLQAGKFVDLKKMALIR